MKAHIRIPTEQYAYIELEVDVGDKSLDEIVAIHDELNNKVKPKPVNSLPDKEYDAFIENMMLGQPNHLDEYNAMSPIQQHFVQIVKRAFKRIKSREEK